MCGLTASNLPILGGVVRLPEQGVPGKGQ
jgi:hypothetical protein